MARRSDRQQLPLRLLEQLLTLEYDADELYRVASEHLADPRYQEPLRMFRADHRRHRDELERLVRELGGTLPAGSDLRGRLEETRMLLAQLGGDDAMLKALQSHAERTGAAYARAVAQAPAEAQDIVLRGRDAEERHRDWFAAAVKALEGAPHRGVPPWNIPPPSGF